MFSGSSVCGFAFLVTAVVSFPDQSNPVAVVDDEEEVEKINI